MGRTKGTSSQSSKGKEVAQEEEDDQVCDLAPQYGAPFPIFEQWEGERYVRCLRRDVVGSRYLPHDIVKRIGMDDILKKMLKQIGLTTLVSLEKNSYVQLTQEFYCTLKLNDNDPHVLDFRMLGNPYQLTYSFMKKVFGFPKDGVCEIPRDYYAKYFWNELTDLPIFDPKRGHAMFIKDHKFWLLHKILACLVFGKSEGNRVSLQEIYLMWCISTKKQVCWTYWIFNKMLECANNKKGPLTHGHVITSIANALKISQSSLDDMRVVSMVCLTKATFTKGKVIYPNFKLKHARDRSCWMQLGQGEEGVQEEESEERESENRGDEQETQIGGASHNAPFEVGGGSSQMTSDLAIWQQVLQNQQAMNKQLERMDVRQQRMERQQRRLSYKMDQFITQSGYHIDSPPPSSH